MLGIPHRLEAFEALAALNRELYLCSLLKTDLSLGSPTSEVRPCEDFYGRCEELIPLGHDFHDDAHCDKLEEAIEVSSPLVVTPSLEFGIVSDTPEGSLIIHDSSLPLASLGCIWY